MNDDKKLYRSRTNRYIAGVCGGLGDYFKMDPTLVRLIFVLAALVGWGTPVILYIVMAIIVPEEPGSGPIEPKVTSAGERVPTGAGGRSFEPAPEPSAGEETVHGPVGTPGEEVYRENPGDLPHPSPPEEPRE
jgi:phage shock protein C